VDSSKELYNPETYKNKIVLEVIEEEYFLNKILIKKETLKDVIKIYLVQNSNYLIEFHINNQ